ncbi:MAG TPA: hypothetical protein VF461_09575, partial [Gemmatimonadaceae bacterium]
MPARHLALLAALTTFAVATAGAQQPKYPPIDGYLMRRDAEIALARTAAPSNISDHATIKILTRSGFEVAHQ